MKYTLVLTDDGHVEIWPHNLGVLAGPDQTLEVVMEAYERLRRKQDFDGRPHLDRLVASLERDYPQNALTQALAATGNLCGSVNPAGDAVCVREPGHGISNMTLPDGRRTYVNHCTRAGGDGEGWGA